MPTPKPAPPPPAFTPENVESIRQSLERTATATEAIAASLERLTQAVRGPLYGKDA